MVEHPKADQTKGVPATTGVKEGSSGRNIQRKGDKNTGKKAKPKGGGGIGGKGDWDPLNDGSS
eukprot:CAMPEP_0194130992 /NCGR_PEP_ID=MMETSP0152-20130528/1860_1 /TAXON_ID=1049557 /ORGANISM="Thalassiothrix antarctica, Strain L6-D1" /LENGTH=62 /DNA_ID=CAMNT_0038825639 /DNA_START=40 /DNA_END=228 /DNA_ORIENTATION=+